MLDTSIISTNLVKLRKQTGLKQQELAEKIHYSDKVISKWERGESVPDVAALSVLANFFGVTLDEITKEIHLSSEQPNGLDASIQEPAQETTLQTAIKRKRFADFMPVYLYTMLAVYGLAILACFIVNLAVSKTLSWFYIVLCGSATLFTISNLPFLLKKFKILIPAACFSVLAFAVLAVCNWFSGGDWFVGFALPVISVSLVILWAVLLVCLFVPLSWWLKGALLSLITAIGVITINPLIEQLTGDGNFGTVLLNYLRPDCWNANIIADKIIFICAVMCSVALTLIYFFYIKKQRASKK